MTQRFSLYEDLSIEREPRPRRRPLPPARRARGACDATLASLGLTSRRRQLAGKLSGGWKQRLALAACIMHAPQLLLLDEPTAGVDPKARREFWDEIHRARGGGMTVLVSTHYMDEAERCHRINYIAYGRLIAEGTVAEVVARSGLHTRVVTGPGLERDRPPPAGEPRGRPGGGLRHVAARGRPRRARRSTRRWPRSRGRRA